MRKPGNDAFAMRCASATLRSNGSPTPEPPTNGDGGGTDDQAQARADLTKALQQANKAIQDGQAALAIGDFTAYGEAQKSLDSAIDAALAAESRLNPTP